MPDKELFNKLFIERRLLGQRFFMVSDPDGIRRVMQDNYDNYPRLTWIRRVFEFTAGSGMLHAEGAPWRRHRRLINPTLDHRAMLPDAPMLIELAEELARHLGALPPGQRVDLHDVFRHLITRSAGQVFAGDDRALDPVLDLSASIPGRTAFSTWCRRRAGCAFSTATARPASRRPKPRRCSTG